MKKSELKHLIKDQFKKRMQELAGIKNNKLDKLDKLKIYLKQNKTNINNNLNYISDNGKIKINSDEVYDFGGSEDPIPNSTVVDIDKPNKNNNFIKQNLENSFSIPSKKYINISSVLHFIKNKNQLIKNINKSLKSGGIIVIKSSLNQILDIIPYLSNYIPLEARIDEKEILSSEDDPDVISIAFKKQ
jgi:SAM-dependent methyltransferase